MASGITSLFSFVRKTTVVDDLHVNPLDYFAPMESHAHGSISSSHWQIWPSIDTFRSPHMHRRSHCCSVELVTQTHKQNQLESPLGWSKDHKHRYLHWSRHRAPINFVHIFACSPKQWQQNHMTMRIDRMHLYVRAGIISHYQDAKR